MFECTHFEPGEVAVSRRVVNHALEVHEGGGWGQGRGRGWGRGRGRRFGHRDVTQITLAPQKQSGHRLDSLLATRDSPMTADCRHSLTPTFATERHNRRTIRTRLPVATAAVADTHEATAANYHSVAVVAAQYSICSQLYVFLR